MLLAKHKKPKHIMQLKWLALNVLSQVNTVRLPVLSVTVRNESEVLLIDNSNNDITIWLPLTVDNKSTCSMLQMDKLDRIVMSSFEFTKTTILVLIEMRYCNKWSHHFPCAGCFKVDYHKEAELLGSQLLLGDPLVVLLWRQVGPSVDSVISVTLDSFLLPQHVSV